MSAHETPDTRRKAYAAQIRQLMRENPRQAASIFKQSYPLAGPFKRQDNEMMLTLGLEIADAVIAAKQGGGLLDAMAVTALVLCGATERDPVIKGEALQRMEEQVSHAELLLDESWTYDLVQRSLFVADHAAALQDADMQERMLTKALCLSDHAARTPTVQSLHLALGGAKSVFANAPKGSDLETQAMNKVWAYGCIAADMPQEQGFYLSRDAKEFAFKHSPEGSPMKEQAATALTALGFKVEGEQIMWVSMPAAAPSPLPGNDGLAPK